MKPLSECSLKTPRSPARMSILLPEQYQGQFRVKKKIPGNPRAKAYSMTHGASAV